MITICCPTRGRPNQMKRLHDSIVKTVNSYRDIELIFYIDDDDQDAQEIMVEYDLLVDTNVKAVIGPRITLADMWNKCMNAGQGPIFMVCADDIVFESKDWDKLVIDKFDEYPDKIILVYGKDGGKNERLATHPFIHKNWIDVTGYFTPPYFSYCMCDKWLDDVAKRLDRRIHIPEISTTHWHCTDRRYGNGQADKTWKEMQAKGIKEDYRGIYSCKRDERLEDVEKLKKFIEGFKYGLGK